MKKILFVLFSSIFLFTQIIPVTSVYATEVTWGDSNVVNLDSQTLELSRKIVGLNLLQELVSNGVTEFSIDNVTSLDDFIDDLLDEIKNSAEQGINPEGLINVNLWNDINNLNNHIDDSIKKVGNFLIENDYPMPSGTGLTFQNYMDVEQGQWWANHKSKLISSPITPFGLRSLSRLENNSGGIEVNPDSNYLDYINYISPPFFIQRSSVNNPPSSYLNGSYTSYSYIVTSVSWGEQSSIGGTFYNSTRTECMTVLPLDVYINYDSSTSKYIVTHSTVSPVKGWKNGNNLYY